jgi:non-ribosomal peptide synthase protein (TIGR01720 family)
VPAPGAPAAAPGDPFFDVAGWNDSFTGGAIPEAEMRDWLAATAERILALAPRRVLEIGCGNGLVLGRVAPATAEYVGTDFSTAALAVLGERIGRSGRDLGHVRLLERPADDFSGFAGGDFDTVILNSVVQYFPGVDYLLRVVDGAVRAVRDGGAVFLGDVRSLPLLDALSASVELFRAPPSLPLAELGKRIRRRRLHEEELLVDPAFFPALARRTPRIREARVLPKGGRFANELTRFRYDVVLRVGAEPAGAAPDEAAALDWRRDELDLEGIRRRLAGTRPAGLVVTGVPNPRLTRENRLLELLDESAGPATAEDLEAALAGVVAEGPGPEDLAALARDLSYSVELSWAAGRRDGSFDALFRRPDAPLSVPVSPPARELRDPDWSRFANDPLLGKLGRHLEPLLRDHLRRRLPAPMVPSAVLLLDSLPRLASGKVDRAALRAAGETLGRDRGRPHLKEAWAAPRTASERLLARVWCELLDLDRAGVRDNFFQLGGDSILGIRVVSRARELGLEIRLQDLFQHQTLAALAHLADARTPGRAADEGPIAGPVPLTPIQRWFFEQRMHEPWHYNQSVLLATRGLDPGVVEAALGHLLRHHDMLRATFSLLGTEGSLAAPGGTVPFARIDLSRLGPDRRRTEIRRATSRLQASLDLADGPLVRAALLDPERLFLAVHHLVVDRVSWPILLEDLERACRRLGEGRPVDLPARTTSYREWAELLARHAGSEEVARELPLWLDLLPGADPGLPVDGPGPNVRASAGTCSSVLGPEETRRLLRFGSEVTDPLLVALVRAVAGWTGRQSLLVELEAHGREELFASVDLSRTVGWFTSTFPVFLDLEETHGDEEALAAVRRRLGALPHHGLGYGLLRHLSTHPDAAALRSLPRPQVRFNYMGRIEPASRVLFGFAGEEEGANAGPRQERGVFLELNGWVAEGELRVDWSYSRDVHRRSTVGKLARRFVAELRGLLRRSAR